MPVTKPLTTEQMHEVVNAVNANGGNQTAAAKALNITRSSIQHRLAVAAKNGIKPDPSKVPGVHGTSTLYDQDGNVKLLWVKKTHEKGQEDWAKHAKEVFDGVTRIPRIPRPQGFLNKDLLTVYPIGDHHVAMYAWAEETGADYDIKIAENLLVSGFAHLIAKAEPSEHAIIINLGDFLHVDNIKNETSRSGHTLDVDTRYSAMIRAALKMLRAAIELALQKHRHVTVYNVIGNHDDIGAQWLAAALNERYEQNPRVTIVTKPGKFHYHQFGKVLIGTTHGDTGAPAKIQGVMSADVPHMWGETKFRYWLTGHVHSRAVQEFPGVMWETFRTLAPGDAWAHAAGYRSGRDLTSITFHREYGEVGRDLFNVAMMKRAA